MFESQQGQEFFFFSGMSKPALGPTQPPVLWELDFFPRGKVAGA